MEMTANGCMVTCTSGDKTCVPDMIQACCDCVMGCMKAMRLHDDGRHSRLLLHVLIES